MSTSPVTSWHTALSLPAKWPELQAPVHWQQLDFISDLHLQASEPANLAAWERYMTHTQADAIFILGDLFDVWIGDDVLTSPAQESSEPSPFEQRCVRTLQAAAGRCSVFFMHGNRDFLVGSDFIRACGISMLEDPTALVFAGQRWLLSHGDALCLDDTDYMQFRALVRTTEWQRTFLAKPLAERKAIAQGLRQQSEARKQSGAVYADVDPAAATQWLNTTQCTQLIHGHTHKPADHLIGAGLHRIVLSDWDMQATPPRAEVLRLSLAPHSPEAQVHRQRLSADSV